ncbi:MAG TPA: large conductance mechanosensitive channel protein MscL [Bacteroidetes bacterium]|nr:large conductance mechanosensitive channel protein MscL [Bacteroidota bacterium]HRI46964.1 large-conductance mechanosensitive channel protein MscL [Ignavibacteriaceae bacterium]
MSVIKEFKKFAMRGNVVDLAVGIIIGGAFGKIVSSLVADVLMPPLGLIIGGINFTDIKFTIKDAVIDSAGKVISSPVTLNAGNFIQSVFDFAIVAFSVFILVKAMNKLTAKDQAKEAVPATPPPPSKEVQLLSEIRDLLKK